MMKKMILVLLICLLLGGCGAEEVSGPSAPAIGQDLGMLIWGDGGALEETSEEEKYYLSFTAKTVDGDEMTSDVLSNSKLTMINVWGTFCNPCLEEMPDLGQMAAEYDSSEFQIIGIVHDVTEQAKQEDIDYAKELIAQTQADYPHLLYGQSLAENLLEDISAFPTTFFVKQDGEVLGYFIGAADKATWEALINVLLEEMEE